MRIITFAAVLARLLLPAGGFLSHPSFVPPLPNYRLADAYFLRRATVKYGNAVDERLGINSPVSLLLEQPSSDEVIGTVGTELGTIDFKLVVLPPEGHVIKAIPGSTVGLLDGGAMKAVEVIRQAEHIAISEEYQTVRLFSMQGGPSKVGSEAVFSKFKRLTVAGGALPGQPVVPIEIAFGPVKDRRLNLTVVRRNSQQFELEFVPDYPEREVYSGRVRVVRAGPAVAVPWVPGPPTEFEVVVETAVANIVAHCQQALFYMSGRVTLSDGNSTIVSFLSRPASEIGWLFDSIESRASGSAGGPPGGPPADRWWAFRRPGKGPFASPSGWPFGQRASEWSLGPPPTNGWPFVEWQSPSMAVSRQPEAAEAPAQPTGQEAGRWPGEPRQPVQGGASCVSMPYLRMARETYMKNGVFESVYEPLSKAPDVFVRLDRQAPGRIMVFVESSSGSDSVYDISYNNADGWVNFVHRLTRPVNLPAEEAQIREKVEGIIIRCQHLAFEDDGRVQFITDGETTRVSFDPAGVRASC